jgi:hypothetical protein
MQHFFLGRLIGGDNSAGAVEGYAISEPYQTSWEMESHKGDQHVDTHECCHNHDVETKLTQVSASPILPAKEDQQSGGGEEIIVKYVQGPGGKMIPIYGRLSNDHHHVPVTGSNGAALETFAMGQERPTCCGMRIPSAIAAASHTRGLIPFD